MIQHFYHSAKGHSSLDTARTVTDITPYDIPAPPAQEIKDSCSARKQSQHQDPHDRQFLETTSILSIMKQRHQLLFT